LLVIPAWEKAALLRGLEAGADYLLLAPYASQSLLGVVRVALLNWATAEPAEPPLETIYEDRAYTLPSERGRLGRALLSVYEDLRWTKSLLSWQQVEILDLRDQLRRERREPEREALWNEMVQGIAHDLANLMETVGTAAAVVAGSSPQPGCYRSALDSALAQAESLISILQNCALFDDEQPPLEPVDAGSVVEEVLQAAALELRAPLIRVVTHVEKLPAMLTNRTILARCLNNLIWNAVQAMPSGGVLEITGSAGGGQVLLNVSDTGDGIPQEMRDKIFLTGHSTKQGHRGLGLTLVWSLVRRSGGEIALVDRPGSGATFAVAFPLAGRESHATKVSMFAKRPIEVG
jgi:signal transduction histidine kinase